MKRDELVSLIDSVRKWTPGQDVHRYDVDSGAAADAILARFAVVELTAENVDGFYAWGNVLIEGDKINVGGWIHGPDTARRVAASLLRAADQIEAGAE